MQPLKAAITPNMSIEEDNVAVRDPMPPRALAPPQFSVESHMEHETAEPLKASERIA